MERKHRKRLFHKGSAERGRIKSRINRKMKEKLIELLSIYKDAFEMDKEPLGAIIGNEVDIILNVEKPYPPLSRRTAYPARPRAREVLEVHIKDLMNLGVLRKLGHKEEV
ncbi:hypothetical protein O181_060905 [Austropuccinia psidii MF-1]|uniref:Uncharacterized protein n=1 Tax=Austropuccinia psidii MF-1 TaxID=1389203 RepID=A0A9Q3EE64_9BASI|nr:hypothetical protein [Austropuccinia psidii MF-1]